MLHGGAIACRDSLVYRRVRIRDWALMIMINSTPAGTTT